MGWNYLSIPKRQRCDLHRGRVVRFIMMTSSNGNIFRVTGPLCGEFTGPGEFPAQRPVTRSFDVFFDLRPNKWLSKQPWGWWFEALSWSLWRHCNGLTDRSISELDHYWFFCIINTNPQSAPEVHKIHIHMMTSSNGKNFPRNWPFVRGIHRSRWIPHTKASDAELWCFLWCAPN